MRSTTELDVLRDFSAVEVPTEDTTIFARVGGSGPPLLLLHGFPETHLMWRDVASRLAHEFSVVCADLRGYGRSGCPASDRRHEPYAKRAMARDMVSLMTQLGFPRFAVAGHDRGGRVAYRLALDHPDRVDRMAVLDIVPTEAVWARADDRFAVGYWPWTLLAQPEPLPERILAAAADAIVSDALGGWGSPAASFAESARSAYVEALRDPEHAHAICEEYRAAASLDREHDRADRAAGRRIQCPVLVLWSGRGPLATWYADAGGPLGVWREWCDRVDGQALDGGHFFPEELPEQTAEVLGRFCAEPSAAAAEVH
jgi:haloacetate dehalogenase